ncbi:MAG: hypothetical protein AB1435_17355 [Chloroflexota bacterium]|jgi:hypothetical protein
MRYQNPHEPAENIGVLLDYLGAAENASSRYVYRGQVKEWDAALLPSIYRRFLGLDKTYTRASSEFAHSLRRCGHAFIEVKPDSGIQKIILDHPHLPITAQEYQALMRLIRDPEFALLISTSGYQHALEQRIVPQTLPYVLGRLSLWRAIIDEMHRAMIRQIGFLQPFGYMLGMTLAQQYGFASELLDLTADLRVAAFFATHDHPTYLFEGPDAIRQKHGTGTGVIYRLPSAEGNVRYERIDSYNYYTTPDQLHLKDLCMRFEDKSSPEMRESLWEGLDDNGRMAMANATIVLPHFFSYHEFMEQNASRDLSTVEKIDQFLHLYYFGGNVRYFRLLDMPPGSFAASRLGRQSAVMIVPDELRIEQRDESDTYAQFQALEDVKTRDGFQRFYFRHTAQPPDVSPIDREYLWPREGDIFQTLISRVLQPTTEAYGWGEDWLPKRLDLVAGGYVESPA